MAKNPSGTRSRSGSQCVHTWVAAVASRPTKPASPQRFQRRPPTFDGRRRSCARCARTAAATWASPVSRTNVDQSVSISAIRPPGRSTRCSSATAAAGSGTHCSVRSDRAASKDASCSSSAAASPSVKRAAHGTPAARIRAARSIRSLPSTPTISPPAPRSGARATAASPGPHPTSMSRCPSRRARCSRSHARRALAAGQLDTASIVATRCDGSAPASTGRVVEVERRIGPHDERCYASSTSWPVPPLPVNARPRWSV